MVPDIIPDIILLNGTIDNLQTVTTKEDINRDLARGLQELSDSTPTSAIMQLRYTRPLVISHMVSLT